MRTDEKSWQLHLEYPSRSFRTFAGHSLIPILPWLLEVRRRRIIVEPTNNERGPISKFVYTFFGIFRKHPRVAGRHLIFTNNLEWLLIFKNISGVVPKISRAVTKFKKIRQILG